MKTIWFIDKSERGGRQLMNIEFFDNEDAARKAAKGNGFWGSDAYVGSFKMYETIEEYKNY